MDLKNIGRAFRSLGGSIPRAAFPQAGCLVLFRYRHACFWHNSAAWVPGGEEQGNSGRKSAKELSGHSGAPGGGAESKTPQAQKMKLGPEAQAQCPTRCLPHIRKS